MYLVFHGNDHQLERNAYIVCGVMGVQMGR